MENYIVTNHGDVFFQKEFVNQWELELPLQEALASIHSLQVELGYLGVADRFRIFGILGDEPSIRIVTEFAYWTEEKSFWEELKTLVENSSAEYNVLWESPYVDSVIYDYGTPREKKVVGPNDGRLETQVELSWSYPLTLAFNLRKETNKLSKITEKFWKKAGVSVI